MQVAICSVYCNIFFLFKLISHVFVRVEIRMSHVWYRDGFVCLFLRLLPFSLARLLVLFYCDRLLV